ncbi:hypothetical protein GCM10023403_22350 [Pseudonocardia benzenivorans]
MSLGSVVRIIVSSVDPLAERRAGYGRVTGFGRTSVTTASVADVRTAWFDLAGLMAVGPPTDRR